MRRELWQYETAIRELEDMGVDISEILYALVSMKKGGLDVNEAVSLMHLATTSVSGITVYPLLEISDIERALQREQKLKLSYQDRKHYPHLRGGRKNLVAVYAEIARTEGKETALRWAARVMSPRSMFRLKKLLRD